MDRPEPSSPHPIVLFDGVCNLCDRSVQFILDRDPTGVFHFASLQSETGRRLIVAHGADPDVLDSVALIDGDRMYRRSDAALEIARHLTAPWRWMSAFRIVPRPLRDVVYDAIAERRYRWFGTRESCRLPTPDVAARFLDL